MQVGRTAFVVVYLSEGPESTDGWRSAIDLIRERIEERCRELTVIRAHHASAIRGDFDRYPSLFHDRSLLGSGSKHESALRCLTGT